MEPLSWSPDRALNPQYADIPDIPIIGYIINHKKPDGSDCFGGVYLDLPGVSRIFPGRPLWHVESLDPLTISPSVRCLTCGDHGFVRGGKWVPA